MLGIAGRLLILFQCMVLNAHSLLIENSISLIYTD